MVMTQTTEPNDERPCLHCLIGDLIDEFYEEYGSTSGEPEVIDTAELVSALAKTFAEFSHDYEPAQRQRLLQDFINEVAKFEVEFQEAKINEVPGSDARH
jgi:hypothetical protein